MDSLFKVIRFRMLSGKHVSLGGDQMNNSSRAMSCPSHSGSISRLGKYKSSPLREGNQHRLASGKDNNGLSYAKDIQFLKGGKVLKSTTAGSRCARVLVESLAQLYAGPATMIALEQILFLKAR